MVGNRTERSTSARLHSSGNTASPKIVTILLLLLISSGIPACATSSISPIDANAPIGLASNEALLIVHIDTDIALESLVLNSRVVARSLGKGRHIWVVRVREGSYRWRRVELASGKRQNLRFDLDPEEELSFAVKAGMINYPGELVIRSGSLSRWGGGDLNVRNRNHSAMAVRALGRRYDRLLRSRPLHYAGANGDTFLEYYQRERDRVIASPGGDASPGDREKARVESP